MRHDKAEQLLTLCIMMASRHRGVTLAMIAERFGVSRRTAERMRDAALRLVPDHNVLTDPDGTRRWRIDGLPPGVPGLSAEQLVALQSAATVMRDTNRPDAAHHLETLAEALLARQSRGRQARLDTDVSALMESEGLAVRPGPHLPLCRDHLETIREGILACRRLDVLYTARHSRKACAVTLEPYGLLYGDRPYLIAKQVGKPRVRHYRVQGLSEVTLSAASFVRDPDFDLHAHAARMFGVFSEPPFDVTWRFAPEVSRDAAEYVFHPSQTTEWRDDGSLVVRFRAGGALEMSWHLARWGDSVTVEQPTDFYHRVEKARNGL